ncbi:PREDICTED: uncharacterized protein LOC105596803 [Cercocebus atys]|uniref:uncharacterized protein LOC105596803 n=1 Tax=Cercocebus atys TaxID=9531 RepID=UPI0005F40476|nr:PREDICTED: uncharacterized protein LOC105596803 [Cercocebus atys]
MFENKLDFIIPEAGLSQPQHSVQFCASSQLFNLVDLDICLIQLPPGDHFPMGHIDACLTHPTDSHTSQGLHRRATMTPLSYSVPPQSWGQLVITPSIGLPTGNPPGLRMLPAPHWPCEDGCPFLWDLFSINGYLERFDWIVFHLFWRGSIRGRTMGFLLHHIWRQHAEERNGNPRQCCVTERPQILASWAYPAISMLANQMRYMTVLCWAQQSRSSHGVEVSYTYRT